MAAALRAATNFGRRGCRVFCVQFWRTILYRKSYLPRVAPKLTQNAAKNGWQKQDWAARAPPSLVLLMRAFCEAYFSLFGALILYVLRNFV